MLRLISAAATRRKLRFQRRDQPTLGISLTEPFQTFLSIEEATTRQDQSSRSAVDVLI
ncbi:hypothetical protein [Leisingera sp. McT4-56]|uniref:hypothetical protein n=1 Tax=Leisingera sp. McT4-56 TaxID=2881255 RepID=UPI001CF7ED54|nr:hypothetical protein [Leisingera sp. McT4-56]